MERIHNNRMYVTKRYFYEPRKVSAFVLKQPKEAKTNTQVKLNGFNKVFTPGVSMIRKSIWFFIVVILLVFSLYQIFNCIDNFFHQPIAVTVDYIKNSSIKAPGIIICPLILTRNVKLISQFWKNQNKTRIRAEDLYNLVDSSTTVKEIWDMSDMIPQDLSLEVIEGLSLVDNWIIDDSALIATKVNGLSGKCTEIHANREIVHNGLYTFIRIRNINELPYPDGTFLQVSVQTETSSHTDRLFVARQGLIFPLHAQVNLYYTMQELRYLNTKENPCSNDHVIGKCVDDCVERIIHEQEKVKCRLPFMAVEGDIELCSTPNDFRKTFKVADELMKNYSLEFCKCPRHCHTTLYNLKSASELHVEEDFVLNLHISFPDNSIQRIKEYASYSYTSLLSDIGGTLGLYLGICLITIFEIIEVVGMKFVKLITCEKKV